MNVKEIKKSDVELVYVYFDKMNEENDGKCMDHFAMNLSPKFDFSYDYQNQKINLEIKEDIYSDDFWRISDNNNITNISLLLGENGVGKTTLLRLIVARATEIIEHDTSQKYLLIYYIKNQELFYVKTTCSDLLEINTKDVSDTNAVVSVLYEGNRRGDKVSGYCGLVTLSKNRKLLTYGSVREVYRLEDLKTSFAEMLPMECIYLPLVSDDNSSIYISRKWLLHTKRDTGIEDVLDFLVMDYESTKYHFISKYPNFIIRATASYEAQNEKFKDVLFELYECFDLVENYISSKRGNYRIDYKKLIHEGADLKSVFFINAMLTFIARLISESNEIHTRILLLCREFMNSLSNPTSSELYNFLCMIIKDEILVATPEKAYFERVISAIDAIPVEVFSDASIKGNPLTRVSCKLQLSSICGQNKVKVIEFIKATKELEKSLNGNDSNFYFVNYKFSEMSTGEYSLIKDVFARLFSLIEEVKVAQQKKSILLVMDEPDFTLHLRWTQSFLYSLIELLNKRYPQYVFQIILSSHMPFLVTDFPRSNVFCLCSKEWRKLHSNSEINWCDNYIEDTMGMRAFHPKNGFMCNYYDILRDAFFIDIPIGKFAQIKYEQIHKKILDMNSEVSEKTLDVLWRDINVIDEPVLRNVLKEKLDSYMDKRRYVKELRAKANELLLEAKVIEKDLSKNDTN